jgi:hypothetical protein
MTRSIFGWDLPPGCTMKDIDDAFGDKPDELEGFLEHCTKHPGMLSKEELQMLEDIWNGEVKEYPVEKLQKLFYQVLNWSFSRGMQQGAENKREAQAYNAMYGDE